MNKSFKKTILLVEDEPLIAIAESRQLKKRGYDVIHVLNGEKAIEAVFGENNIVDLILMDIDLGLGMDGTEAAKVIIDKKDIPVVFLSNHIEPEIVEKTEDITSYGYVVKSSSITVLDASIKMAFRLYDAKKTEMNYISFLDNIMEQSPFAMWIANTSGIVIKTNRALRRLLNLSDEFILGKYNVLNDQNLKQQGVMSRVEGVFKDHKPAEFSISWEGKDAGITEFEGANSLLIAVTMFPLLDRENNLTNVVCQWIDITERKIAEDELRREKSFTDMALDAQIDTFFLFEPGSARAIRWNMSFRGITGYSDEEIASLPVPESYFSPQDLIQIRVFLQTVLKEGPGMIELELICRDGRRIPTEYMVSAIVNEQWDQIYFIFIGRNITERRRSEAEIKQQLFEKDLILNEAHHLINNNLSSIESLLSLQSRSITNQETVSALREASNRVGSMRVLYEKMLTTGNYKEISVKKYIGDLVHSVISAFPRRPAAIIKSEIDDFYLEPNRIISLGIIVNELFTNSLKHAFENRDPGVIQISIIRNDKHVRLMIQDNGVGLPEDFDENSLPGFGITLVKILSSQLGGHYSIDGNNGTNNTIEFDI